MLSYEKFTKRNHTKPEIKQIETDEIFFDEQIA